MLCVLGGAHVEPKIGIVNSAVVLYVFSYAKVKATCHTEGTGRAPDGSGKPPAGWPGGYKTIIFHWFL